MAGLVSRYFDFIFVEMDEVDTCPSLFISVVLWFVCLLELRFMKFLLIYCILHLIPVLSVFLEDI